nr:GNAT family N-acetyltransferase [Microcella alkalica]
MRGFVETARAAGLEIRELDARDAAAIESLDAESWVDVPTTPATVHVPVSALDVRDWATRGRRAFGALDGDRLVGLCVGAAGDNDFVVVAPDQRGRGIGGAVVAAWMLGAIEAGERSFSAGGALQNARSLAMIRAVGFRVTERWLSLQRP